MIKKCFVSGYCKDVTRRGMTVTAVVESLWNYTTLK